MSDQPAAYVILSTQRTGSHLLGDIVGSHPEFVQAGEVLLPNARRRESFNAFCQESETGSLQEVWHSYLLHLQRRKFTARHVGFLVKYGDVKRIGGFDLTTDSMFSELQIIHLVRQNTLRVVASQRLAIARKVHVTRKPLAHEINSVIIPPDTAMGAIKKKAASVQEFRQKLSRRPNTMEITYEEIMNAEFVSEDTVTRLCTFFGVRDRFTRSPEIVKLAPRRLSDMIENYDEVASALQGTEFEQMLD